MPNNSCFDNEVMSFCNIGFKMCLKDLSLSFPCQNWHLRVMKHTYHIQWCAYAKEALYRLVVMTCRYYSTHHILSFRLICPPHFSNCLLSKTLLVSNAPLDDHLIQSAKQTFDPKYLIFPIIFLIECCGLCVSNLVVWAAIECLGSIFFVSKSMDPRSRRVTPI